MNDGWRLTILAFVVVFITVLVLFWAAPLNLEGADDVRAYFPAWAGAQYKFAGEGLEFAAFSRKITFAEDNRLQMEDLSGTNLAQVVEWGKEEIKIIYSREEFYLNESLLNEEPTMNLILLKAPLKEGAVWQDDFFTRQITAVDQVVTVPLGTFRAVVVVKAVGEHSSFYEYYAKNMGLIKRETIFGAENKQPRVVSSLKEVTITPQLP